MDKRFDKPRTISRVAPKQAATASFFRHHQQVAYGIITNVSVSGACIVTDNTLMAGSDIDVQLSFFQEPQLFDIKARVVWNRMGRQGEQGLAGLQLHGVRFMDVSALQRSQLHEVLVSENFENVFKPATTEFELFQSSLSSELDQVVSHFQKATGQES